MGRDFIPQGDNLTPDEQRRVDAAAAAFKGGVKQDFIPPVGWAKPFVKPRAEQIQDAFDAADKRAERAKERQYQDAVMRLRLLDPSQAVEDMQKLPEGVRTLWLVAESNNMNRAAIMDSFGKIGDEDRQQFDPTFVPKAAEEGKTAAQVPAKTPARKASSAKVPA
jgi:hypothetical protein